MIDDLRAILESWRTRAIQEQDGSREAMCRADGRADCADDLDRYLAGLLARQIQQEQDEHELAARMDTMGSSIDSRTAAEDELSEACAAVLDPRLVTDERAAANFRRVRDAAKALLRLKAEGH